MREDEGVGGCEEMWGRVGEICMYVWGAVVVVVEGREVYVE